MVVQSNKSLLSVAFTFLLGCKATKIWGLFRHGSRSPSKKIINKMKTELKLLRNQILEQNNKLCDKDRKRLLHWHPMHDDEDSAKFLIDTGNEELFGLGERFKNRFPDLLNTMYSNETHYVGVFF
jgi:multiple inositol-polyphosphate phosphatase / 2,3-bisphosphoglycerate 3-phosphatase